MPYSNEHSNNKCCDAPLSDKEVDLLDDINISKLSEREQSTLYYISGYVASKHQIGLDAPETCDQASEFTSNVSRGRLQHPTAELFELAMNLYVYYESITDNSCSNRLMKAFTIIYESSICNFENENKILRRFINCFAKGLSNNETEEMKVENANRKKRKDKQYSTCISQDFSA